MQRALAILVCCLLFQYCKQDEPLLIDVYPVRAVLVSAGGERLQFQTIIAPPRPIVDYLYKIRLKTRVFIKELRGRLTTFQLMLQTTLSELIPTVANI